VSKEQWKPILGYENYEISDRGRIWSNNCKRLLHPYSDSDGYLKINLYSQGVRTAHRVHRLVAMEFIPNPEGYAEVHHRDRSRTNNCVTNLEWRKLYHGVVDENLAIVDRKTGEILYACYTYKEAAHYSGISEELIKAEVESGEAMTISPYRFEKF